MTIDKAILTFRTKRLNEFDVIFEKVNDGFNKVSNGEKCDKEIFLDEIAVIHNLAALSLHAHQLKSDGKSTELREKIEKAAQLIKAIELMPVNNHPTSGFFDSGSNKAFNFFSNLNQFVSQQLISDDNKHQDRPSNR